MNTPNIASRRTSWLLAAAALCVTTSASAEIALFTNGRTLKISAFSAQDDSMSLTLQSGGKITLPIEQIERIIDDEWVPPPPVVTREGSKEGVFPERSWKYDETITPIFQTKFNPIIVAAAKKFDVDAALVSAVIKAESDYNPRTVSHKGARGLMQLMPATARRFGVSDSFDPVANIHAGTRYLRWLLNKFEGNADLAVAAYNAGEGNVWKYNGVPPFRETVQYIKRVAGHVRKASEPLTAANRS